MEFITQNILLVTLFLVSGVSVFWNIANGGSRGQVSPAEATRLINQEEAVVLDVRDAGEYAGGHLIDALNIPFDKLGERAAELEKFKDRTLLVYCAAGVRSSKACAQLAKLGFGKVSGLAGGVDAWVAAGYPLKKGGRGK